VVSATVEGLTPGTAYHLRVVAKNSESPTPVPGPDTVFRTFGEEPVFGPCPNDEYRTGPSARLPDCRAYEQVSSEKNGADVGGQAGLVQGSTGGDAIAFFSPPNLPGAVGAQELQTFLARRGAGAWSTAGVLPPASVGPVAANLGWTADLSFFFSSAAPGFGEASKSFLLRDSATATFTSILSESIGANFVGASSDGRLVYFESEEQLTPEAISGTTNLYVWDRDSGEISLAGVLPDSACAAPPCPPAKGSIGGPWNWFETGERTYQGGIASEYYVQALHTISADGSRAYFTDRSDGQLYLREDAAGPDPKTVHVSASERRPTPDPLGPRPAAFMGATPDGSKAFFTSPQMLTADAKTGPEQGVPAIGRADIDGKPESVNPDCIPARATGLATNSEYIYWADPVAGAIGRAELGCGGSVESDFILTGDEPRWVAVDDEHIYWTSSSGSEGGVGEIGRADIDGKPASIEADFISGKVETAAGFFVPLVDKPQGIAVNSEYVYWANDGTNAIARAEIGGGNPEPEWHVIGAQEVPQGVAVDASHIYWATNNPNSFISRADLDGSNETFKIVSEDISAEVRGVALDGAHLYWVQKAGNTIGRANLDLGEIEKGFIAPEGALHGLAVDPTHIYWTVNGEAVPNPGNDLYEFDATKPEGQRLTDLASDPNDPNGAEVKGLLGTSDDGSYVYFAANGDLDGAGGSASAGDCEARANSGGFLNASGHCSLYLAHGGELTYVATLDANGEPSDATNWEPKGLNSSIPTSEKTARVSADGHVLLFHSGPSLYRYDTEAGLSCVSCNPTGAAPGAEALLQSIGVRNPFTVNGPPIQTRNLSADGNHLFFETATPLVAADVNAKDGCERFDRAPSCQDVYEWEAPGAGTCTEASGSFSPTNGGCLYLLSTGTSPFPSFFADASASGNDAFIFTRQPLVPADGDGAQDVYDVRVGGGLAAQHASEPLPCEAEACKPEASPPPPAPSCGSACFAGPASPQPKRHHHKKKRHHKKHKASRNHHGGRK
jgi:hypothetical protein